MGPTGCSQACLQFVTMAVLQTPAASLLSTEFIILHQTQYSLLGIVPKQSFPLLFLFPPIKFTVMTTQSCQFPLELLPPWSLLSISLCTSSPNQPDFRPSWRLFSKRQMWLSLLVIKSEPTPQPTMSITGLLQSYFYSMDNSCQRCDYAPRGPRFDGCYVHPACSTRWTCPWWADSWLLLGSFSHCPSG